jgi:alcohol oxidase
MKVIIENGRATGVTFRRAGAFPVSVYAKKLVVVSAGALGTPQVLERSGVGNPELLEPLGIKVESALKGVGENLQDHCQLTPSYKTDGSFDDSVTFLMGGDRSIEEDEFVKNGSGRFATNFVEVAAKLAPRTEDDWKFVGEKNKEYYTKYSDRPSVQLTVLSFSLPSPLSTVPLEEGFDRANSITSCCWTTYPFSKGSIHITTANDSAPPDYDPNFYNNEDDIKMSIWAYETVDKISMKIPGVIGRVNNSHPQPGQSTEDYIKQFVCSTWHVLGSARMGKPEAGGVVNEKLEVHGVEELMVADLSVCIGNIGANTFSTALMIGEKAADLVATKLGLTLNIPGEDSV